MHEVAVLIPLIGTISVFGTIGFISYLFFRGRHRERMSLIENGLDATIFNKARDIHSNLKWGYLGVAIGLALVGGHFLEQNTTMDDGAGYFPLVFIMGGVAFLLYYKKAKHDYLEEDI